VSNVGAGGSPWGRFCCLIGREEKKSKGGSLERKEVEKSCQMEEASTWSFGKRGKKMPLSSSLIKTGRKRGLSRERKQYIIETNKQSP